MRDWELREQTIPRAELIAANGDVMDWTPVRLKGDQILFDRSLRMMSGDRIHYVGCDFPVTD